ncbi:dTDP-4-dehydrorhamnose 3,5-epimerase [Flavobacterium sp. JP2137]|uniref:dTDP-4-dehydrorhamnose 3,5-epimerase n=1 Tax=Flavobacterium sp. JP2137 TaxID=3414510 RepID=UPI003D2FF5F2
MTITPTELAGCFVLEPKVFFDSRGYFMESFNEKLFHEMSQQQLRFVQDNQSFSTKGVLRGLHYQTGVYSQSKLVRVLQGSVLDVAVDIRPDSATFGRYHAEILSDQNHKQVFVPKGFAHGFLVLSDTALFAYKCDQYYHAASEGGIIYNDATIAIDWILPEAEWIVSEKDRQLPAIDQARKIW